MEFTIFKDVLFDLINECEQYDIEAIDSYDRENRLIIHTEDGHRYEIRLKEIQSGAEMA